MSSQNSGNESEGLLSQADDRMSEAQKYNSIKFTKYPNRSAGGFGGDLFDIAADQS